MVANEWNELQTVRKTSVEFTLMAVAFFLVGLKYQYLATRQPDGTDLTEGPKNDILFFCITCVFWLSIWFAQYCFNDLIWQRCGFSENPSLAFRDMCEFAKVSVLGVEPSVMSSC